MAILQFVLGNDTHGLEDGLVLRIIVTKRVSQNGKVLEAPIEAFMASSSTSLECLDFGCVTGVSDGASGVLVESVSNHLFARRNLALESIRRSIHGQIIRGSWFWASNPSTLIIVNGKTDFIAKASTIRLV